jgi:hypothetical protein
MITGFWHVTPCGLVYRYQQFRGTCSLYSQGMLKMQLRGSCGMLVAVCETMWSHTSEDLIIILPPLKTSIVTCEVKIKEVKLSLCLIS